MNCIKVKRGKFTHIIYERHIMAISSSNVEDETYIRLSNGDPLLVEGTLREIEEKIKKASSNPIL